MRHLPALLVLVGSASLSTAAPTAAPATRAASRSLEDHGLQKVLRDAAPIFGPYITNRSSTANWMNRYPDHTKLVDMNLPGTHDAQTWNYSLATQEYLDHVTALTGEPQDPPEFFRTQARSLNDMLNDGIRVFDLRVAFDVTNSTLVFWHSQALQSQTATLEDVLFGFYRWLDDHSSEAVLISLNYEGSTTIHAQNNAAVQLALYNALTTTVASQYFLPTQNELGTLGEARGKITLLRRFNLDALPASHSATIPGVYFPGSQWTDNGPDIALVYNAAENLTAYIEDYYETAGTGPEVNIEEKFNATTAHLLKAATTTRAPDSLFWSFASSEHTADVPPETPIIMALGNGSVTPLGGVNQRLVPFFQGLKGKRVGIVMFDFYDTPGNLIETFLAM